MSDQWLRRIQLVVTPGLVTGDNQGLDLSEMHIQFHTNAADVETLSNVYIRIYNLSPKSMNAILDEYNGVILSAGYEGEQFGMIFKGTLKQIIRGRASPVDTFLDLYAADGDGPYLFARLNAVIPAPVTPAQQLANINEAFGKHGLGPSKEPPPNTTFILPRSKVQYGLGKLGTRDYAETQMEDWSIQNGTLQLTPKNGYRGRQTGGGPDTGFTDIIQINQTTGMIGVPQQTQDGIQVTTLLNARFQVGDLVQLNAAEIDQTMVRGGNFPRRRDTIPFFSTINDADRGGDGLYRILVVEHRGDTRGQPWYTDLVCLAAPGGQVELAGEFGS